MDFRTYNKRLNYLLELIEKNQIDSPIDITSKFNCSERTIRRMINDLRDDGHRIEYCRRTKKYILNNT